MSRLWKRIYAGVAIVAGNPIEITNFLEPARNGQDMLALGSLARCVDAGGSEIIGIDASATGDQYLIGRKPLYFDNASAQWSGTPATFVFQYGFLLRVSSGAITLTPKLWYASTLAALFTAPSVATISGASACSATNEDYSGANQIQTVSATVPSGANWWLAGVTIGGTPAAGYQGFAEAWRDAFISS